MIASLTVKGALSSAATTCSQYERIQPRAWQVTQQPCSYHIPQSERQDLSCTDLAQHELESVIIVVVVVVIVVIIIYYYCYYLGQNFAVHSI